jgi:hypothetical protein
MVRTRTVFRYKKTRVVKFRTGGDNGIMNLFLALFWLICAVMLLVYEQMVGPTRFRMDIAGHHFSWAWLMLLLVLYNLKRWWQIHSERVRRRAAATARANEERERLRHSKILAETPDPNFHFFDEPPPPSKCG